jgi:hypothetical protein
MDLLVVRYFALALCLMAGCAFSQSVTQAPSNTVLSNCSISNDVPIPSSIACVAGVSFSNANVNMGVAGAGLIYSPGTYVYGTASAGPDTLVAPYRFFLSGDTVDTTTSGPGYLAALAVTDAIGAGATGGRYGTVGRVVIVGSASANNGDGYVGTGGYVASGFNVGGTTGAYGNYKGAMFGGGSQVLANSGATFYSLVNGWEDDTQIVSGASSADHFGHSIVLTSGHAVRGVYDDAGLEISSQDGATATWLRGFSFGGAAHAWSFGADSTLIGAQARTIGGSSSPIALNGIDFSAVTFQSGGCSFKSTGFCVDPSGNITANNVKAVLSGTTASIGGGALLAGGCSTGTVTVTGATTSMAVVASPTTSPGAGAYWQAYVSSANTVTVGVCATIALTPTASTYNVRVLQ